MEFPTSMVNPLTIYSPYIHHTHVENAMGKILGPLLDSGDCAVKTPWDRCTRTPGLRSTWIGPGTGHRKTTMRVALALCF